MKEVKMKNAYAVIPENWIMLYNHVSFEEAVNIGIIEVKGYPDMPHFTFLTEKQDVDDLSDKECEKLIELCSKYIPDIYEIWKRDGQRGYAYANIGFFNIPVYGKSLSFPYGCMMISQTENCQG